MVKQSPAFFTSSVAPPPLPLKAPMKNDFATGNGGWDSLAHHYEMMKKLLYEYHRDTNETSYSSSNGSDSPRRQEISVPLEFKPHASSTGTTEATDSADSSGCSNGAIDLRYIGEGLLDLSDIDAVSRLSGISNESDVEGACALPADAVIEEEASDSAPKSVCSNWSVDAPIYPTHQQPEAPVKSTSASTSSRQQLQPQVGAKAALKGTPEPSHTSNKSRSKFLDFVATEVNDDYLNNVYQDEEEEDEEGGGEGEGGGDAEDLAPQRHRRTNDVNSKLRAFLSKAEGERANDNDTNLGTKRQETTKQDKTIAQTKEHPRFEIIYSDDDKEEIDVDPLERRRSSSFHKLQAFLAANGVNNPETLDESLAQREALPTSQQREHQKPAPQRMGSRFTSFFNRYTAAATSQPAEVNQPKEPPTVRQQSASMVKLLQRLGNIKAICEQNELSEVAIDEISTMLAAISEAAQKHLSNDLRRPLSCTNPAEIAVTAKVSWAKTAKEREIEEKLHLASQNLSVIVEPAPSPRVLQRVHFEQLPLEVAPTVGESMRAFENAQNLPEVLSTYHHLLLDCGLATSKLHDPWAVYHHFKSGVYKKISFRRKQLFKLLDKKLSTEVYRRKPSGGKRVCIIGAGPIGLRAAVEMALLGAQVVVIEKRKRFSRENILHLWPWVVQDLTSLGAKVLFPAFCHTTGYYHVGTRQLQCILLKVALLLGVTVFPATAYEGIARPDSLPHNRRPFYSVITKPQIPWMEFSAVLSAAGTQDKFSQDVGLERFVFARKEAIGLVCFFPNRGTKEEKRASEFMWTAQFKKRLFAKLRALRLDLENIVYYRGEMHYLVMTPKRQSLLEEGILRTNYQDLNKLLADNNINVGKLHAYVTRVIRQFKIPQKAPFAKVRLFDFSTRTRADKAASVLLASNGQKLYAGLIGDALLEPFWPEGLGTCRGFLSALDSAWMVSQIGKQSDEQLLADRELGYRIIQHISGVSRGDLQTNVRKYNCDPRSRYTLKFPAPVQ